MQLIVTRKRLYDEDEEATQPEGCGAMLAAFPGEGGRPQNAKAEWWISFPDGKIHIKTGTVGLFYSMPTELKKRINIAFLEGWRCWALWDANSQQSFSLRDDKNNKLTITDAYERLNRYFDWVDGKWWEELVSVSYWVHEVEIAIKNEIIPSDTPSDKYILLVCNMTIDVTNNALVLARSIIESEKVIND